MKRGMWRKGKKGRKYEKNERKVFGRLRKEGSPWERQGRKY